MAIFARIPFAIFTMLALSSVTHHVMGEPGIYYVQDDHLGTPQALYDINSQVIWRSDYAPFGQANVDEDPDRDGRRVSFPIRFPGQYLDRETGLHYNYFRDYDPSLGRYVQSDPIGLGGGLNTYFYAYQNPLINVDPYGLRVPTDGGCYGPGCRMIDTFDPTGERGLEINVSGCLPGICATSANGGRVLASTPQISGGVSICTKRATPRQCDNSEFDETLQSIPGDSLTVGYGALGVTINDDLSVCIDFGIGALPVSISKDSGPIFE